MSGKTETHLVVATSTSNTGELQSGRLFLSLLRRPAVVRSRIRSRSIRLVSKRSMESVVCVNHRYDLADRASLHSRSYLDLTDLRFRSFFYGTMLSKNGITLPKTPPALCRVFVPAVARLRMLRMSPGAVLNIAPFITALLGVVR